MFNIKVISVFVFGLISIGCYPQQTPGTGVSQSKVYPSERVHLHFNDSFLLAGEYLYYKLYCIDEQTNSLSSLSKIGYVALINSHGEEIFRHKITLENGMGQGDFFVPTSVTSGSYKLLGYTQWMGNLTITDFFQSDVIVVNPYIDNLPKPIALETNSKSQRKDSFRVPRNDLGKKRNEKPTFTLKLSKQKFGVREKVSLLFEGEGNRLDTLHFSVSVRKYESSIKKGKNKIHTFSKSERISPNSPSKEIILPELRGDLISGIVKEASTGQLVKDVKLIVTIPGETYQIRVVSTNENGRFFANFSKSHQLGNLCVQFLDTVSAKRVIEIQDFQIEPDYSKLEFKGFELNPMVRDMLLERSVQNQIENAFYSVKPDTLILPPTKPPFYGTIGEKYVLDDYTRFATVKETVVEILNNVWISKKNGKSFFGLRNLEKTDTDSGFATLVLIDGIPLQDQTNFVDDFDARKIESIRIIRNQYRLGAHIFNGIIDIKTSDQLFLKSFIDSGKGIYPISIPQPKKNYFNQDHSAKESTKRIPDQRRQLLWSPMLRFTGHDVGISFFTSDVTGVFEIVLQGFTNHGTPVSITKTILVE